MTLRHLGFSNKKIQRLFELDRIFLNSLWANLEYKDANEELVVKSGIEKAKLAELLSFIREYLDIIEHSLNNAQERRQVLESGERIFEDMQKRYTKVEGRFKKET